MTSVHLRQDGEREVLVSQRAALDACGWLSDMAGRLRAFDLVVTPARSSRETIERVESGGLAGAVLVGDPVEIDGLSLLRVVRSIDAELPCWLVAAYAGRHTIQTALALRATGVLAQPVDVSALSMALLSVLARAL
ncbi:MAG: hypothetical protein ACE5E6_09535 [Phycisphaerae bacterium]